MISDYNNIINLILDSPLQIPGHELNKLNK